MMSLAEIDRSGLVQHTKDEQHAHEHSEEDSLSNPSASDPSNSYSKGTPSASHKTPSVISGKDGLGNRSQAATEGTNIQFVLKRRNSDTQLPTGTACCPRT